MRRFIGFGIALALMLTSFAACGKEDVRSEDIVVLYTNDVYCGIEDNIGYAGLAAYKKSTEQTYKYVTLVDCGDGYTKFMDNEFIISEGISDYQVLTQYITEYLDGKPGKAYSKKTRQNHCEIMFL